LCPANKKAKQDCFALIQNRFLIYNL